MAKGGLGKLRCMIRRWHSSSRIARTPPASDDDGATIVSSVDARGGGASSFHGADEVPKGLHPVYVGKSRRRYLIASSWATCCSRPSSTAPATRGAAGTIGGCEVVLFEHLLWMLENAEPQPESLDELVDYYAC